ncbi:MAG: PKD domain-containing protein [Candidatus Microsaccharimonas sp.]
MKLLRNLSFGVLLATALVSSPILTAHTASAEQAVYTCDALTVTQTGPRTITTNLSYTAKYGAGMQMTTYDFGDSKVIGSHLTTQTHTYAQPGTYKVSAAMRIIVDNKRTINGVTSPACQTTVTVTDTVSTASTMAGNNSSSSSNSSNVTATASASVTELPKTGLANAVLGSLGLGLIVFFAVTYFLQKIRLEKS